jgi:hypothetical protein
MGGLGMSPATVHRNVVQADRMGRICRRPDSECHARAADFLAELVRSSTGAISWDTDHRLRGHVFIHGLELVIIAARDTGHEPVVLTELDWGRLRTASAEERSALLRRCAIADHDRLEAILARNDPVPTTDRP